MVITTWKLVYVFLYNLKKMDVFKCKARATRRQQMLASLFLELSMHVFIACTPDLIVCSLFRDIDTFGFATHLNFKHNLRIVLYKQMLSVHIFETLLKLIDISIILNKKVCLKTFGVFARSFFVFRYQHHHYLVINQLLLELSSISSHTSF